MVGHRNRRILAACVAAWAGVMVGGGALSCGAQSPHQVLEPPAAESSHRPWVALPTGQHAWGQEIPRVVTEFNAWAGGLGNSRVFPRPPTNPIVQRLQPSAPEIPQAVREPTWKTPHAYGHFGATRNRQWTRQHGFRDRETRWTYR